MIHLNDHPLKGIAYYSMAVLMFALVGAFAHLLKDNMQANDIVFVRSLIVSVIMFATLLWQGRLSLLKTRNIKGHARRSVIGFISLLTITLSYMLMPISEATIVLFTNPFFVALLSSPMLGERVSRLQWIAMAIGFAGVLIALAPGFQTLKWGMLVALISAFCTAMVSIFLRDMGKTEPSETIVFYFSFFCTLVTAALYFFVPCHIDFNEIPMLVGIGLAAYVAQICLTRAHQFAPSAQLVPFQYAGILWAGLIDFFVFGLVPHLYVYIGGAIVIGSGMFLLYEASKKKIDPGSSPG